MNKSYQLITKSQLEELAKKARTSPRKRMNYNLHELPDKVQRFLNAIEPGSYVRPHRHLNPSKAECFCVLKGKFAVLVFDDCGDVTERVELDEKKRRIIDIRPAVWHTVVSLKKGSVFFEVKDGPYEPASDKDFAPWAPKEDDPEAALYLKDLLK